MDFDPALRALSLVLFALVVVPFIHALMFLVKLRRYVPQMGHLTVWQFYREKFRTDLVPMLAVTFVLSAIYILFG
jgi:hypothetical protein